MKAGVPRPNDPSPLVRLRNVSHRFGSVVAIEAHDLEIEEGSFLALLGPSGCGKTTLLRIIGGFLEPTTGTIEIAGEDVTHLGPNKRRTNMVFQGYGLFPHMTVRQNVAYGLVLAKRARHCVDEAVDRMLGLVRLEGLADRLPGALSGGQAQRVALARALIMDPAVLLLDESLAALDLKLRKAMQNELRQLHRTLGGTFVFVTHDQNEAMGLATQIAVMREGRIEQRGTPEEIYRNPANEFVAGFIGEANVIHATRRSNRIMLDGSPLTGDCHGPDGDVAVIVRPDAIDLVGADDESDVTLSGLVIDRIFLGSHVSIRVRLSTGQELTLHRSQTHGRDPDPGETITLGWRRDRFTVVAGDP